MSSKETIESIIKNCQLIELGVEELSLGVQEFKRSMEKQPSFVKPLVKGDFKSGIGLSMEELERFLDRLKTCFKRIENDVKQLAAVLDKKEGEIETSETLKKLKDSTKSFLNAADVIIETINKLVTYLQSLPDKINMIPQQFMSDDERKSLLQLMPEYEEKATFLVQLFVTVSVQLNRLNKDLTN
jgi:predicted nuclease with TOPRIM domain